MRKDNMKMLHLVKYRVTTLETDTEHCKLYVFGFCVFSLSQKIPKSGRWLNWLFVVLALAWMPGCAHTPITPAQLSQTVSQGVIIGLDVSPEAAPELRIAQSVICAEAAQTNVSPQAISADLYAAGITNAHSKLIVDGGLLLYSTALNLVGTNIDAAEPYLQALCTGFTDALPPPGSPQFKKASRMLVPPHLR